MKRSGILGMLTVCALGFLTLYSSSASAAGPIVKVTVSPDSATVIVGGETQFSAAAKDSSQANVNTAFSWSLSDSTKGSIGANGLFKGSAVGKSLVIVKAAAFSDTATVSVTAAPKAASIQIFPDSASVAIGDTVKFEAGLKDSTGAEIQGIVTWTVSNTTIGTIDDNGFFKGKAVGNTKVIAASGAVSDTALVTVTQGKPPVEPGVNRVSLYRQSPEGKITKFGSGTIEGGTVTIGGIPSPLNFLNGMKLTFPRNSLHEDITITFKIPEFAKVDSSGKNVAFGDSIITGVTFEVSVDGKVKSPYPFDAPLELTIPFKRGLLTKLGITPAKIGMFFASPTGALQADSGVTTAKVDSISNFITGNVAHFSTIVIAPTTGVATSIRTSLPQNFQLMQNMPNPFNPATTIAFRIDKSSQVTLSIYNILGQEVTKLINTRMEAGSYSVVWDATNQNGAQVTSGVYFYRLKAGSHTSTMKLMFMK